MFCTVPDIAEFLQPLEDVICCALLPVLLVISTTNDTLHNVIALPPCWGGLGILNPTTLSAQEYSASLTITEPLSHHIGSGQSVDYFQVKSEQFSHLSKQSMYSNTSASLRVELDHASQISLYLTMTRGASAWLLALPLTEYGFILHKAAFHDTIALRYDWPLHRTPSHCAYGTIFLVDHALSCPKGGLPSLRHNEIRDLTARLLTEVCHQVQVEPVYSLSAILVHFLYPQLTLKKVLIWTLL